MSVIDKASHIETSKRGDNTLEFSLYQLLQNEKLSPEPPFEEIL